MTKEALLSSAIFKRWLSLPCLLAAMLLLSGCVMVQPAAEAAEATTPKDGEIMDYPLDDLTMRYEVFGEGQPILMLHGRPTDRHSTIGAFEPIFNQRDGWQRIYVDLPGMGETTGGSWINSTEDVVAVLTRFMDDLYPEQDFLVAGFSYGGLLARGVLHEKYEQIDGMMLLAPNVAGPYADRLVEPHRVIVSNPEGLAQFPAPVAELLNSLLVVQEDAVLARQMEIVAGIQRADQEMMARLSESSAYTFDVDALPALFEKPVLILTGKHDSVTGYKQAGELLQYYPRATYAVLDSAGHGLHTEQPALFNMFVHEWLDRVEEAQYQTAQQGDN